MKRVTVSFVAEDGREDIGVQFRSSSMDDQVDALMKLVEDPLAGTLTVLDDDGATVVLAKDRIVSVSASNKRLKLIADGRYYYLKMSLQGIEKALNPNVFLRISRYEIINLCKVQKFDFSVDGTLHVFLEGGSHTWASRRYIPMIRNRLQRKG